MPVSTIIVVFGSWLLLLGMTWALARRDRGGGGGSDADRGEGDRP